MIVPNLIEPHPRFSSATNSHDIALIGIPRSVRLSEFIKPVCLPAPDPNSELAEIEEQRRRVVIGWGKAGEGTPLAKTLQKVDMAVVDDQICQDIYLIYRTGFPMFSDELINKYNIMIILLRFYEKNKSIKK